MAKEVQAETVVLVETVLRGAALTAARVAARVAAVVAARVAEEV